MIRGRVGITIGVAILLIGSACSNGKDEQQSALRKRIRAIDPNPTVGISEDSSASCYADDAWADLQTTANTVQWVSQTGKNYWIKFPAPPPGGSYPLADNHNVPLASVQVSYATPSALYHLTTAALNGCTSATATGCYFPYDILDSGGVNSCVQHYGNFTIGVHVTP
jgi:hypothetical protein